VHMLSTSSFNALLKTLEEPPPHVKFLLATTDPQKLPPTVLSRCLQFTLKHMPPERVVEHLTYVLGEEHVEFDESALWLLGKAAEGSMRDAMSLTDQAIAFGQGAVRHADVAAMLGTLDHRHILGLAEALADVDVQRLLGEVAQLAEQGPDFAAVLDELSSMLHRLAVAQMVPDAVDNSHGDRDIILQLASRFTAEDIQLYYQIGIQGRGDMVHAPDLRSALEMTLLRMLAFRPQGVPKPPRTPLPLRREPSETAATQASVVEAASPAPQSAPEADTPSEAPPPESQSKPPAEPQPQASVPAAEEKPPLQEPPPWTLETDTAASEIDAPQQAAEPAAMAEPERANEPEPTVTPEPAAGAETVEPTTAEAPTAQPGALSEASPETQSEAIPETVPEALSGKLDNAKWLECFDSLGLGGLTRNLAGNCLVESDDGTLLTLRLDPSQEAMQAEVHQTRIERALKEQGIPRRIAFYVAELSNSLETPRQREERLNKERHAQAVDLLNHDPHVQKLQQAFGAKLIESSVKPADAIR
ncbi:MAG: DNA polymerase III subunit gamma/tau, partial [Gammaproteobacteria bacterium]|nr:DNA polymerase III subunit gamma/tau [Gammaproteobacteria bacterium]